ncbi:hypothetical protein BHM03_00000672 [Ensete ventricosum]|nr:hypothetical protein BHM03_00000672 [Ensete ventricosum]
MNHRIAPPRVMLGELRRSVNDVFHKGDYVFNNAREVRASVLDRSFIRRGSIILSFMEMPGTTTGFSWVGPVDSSAPIFVLELELGGRAPMLKQGEVTFELNPQWNKEQEKKPSWAEKKLCQRNVVPVSRSGSVNDARKESVVPAEKMDQKKEQMK